jgi:hypothetical protein
LLIFCKTAEICHNYNSLYDNTVCLYLSRPPKINVSFMIDINND